MNKHLALTLLSILSLSSLISCSNNNNEVHNKEIGITPNISEDNKTLTYGLYPQSHVNDTNIIDELNKLTSIESNGYYLYNNMYYHKLNANPFNDTYTFLDNTLIEKDQTYRFKCEPITWNILNIDNNTYTLLSNVLLDAHVYYSSPSIRTIDGNLVYANNYKYSDIRSWLNNEFYNSAFSLNDSLINIVEVDNSASTTDKDNNTFVCENTMDKVYLPSYKDYLNMDVSIKKCKVTDFALANGAYMDTSEEYNRFGWYYTRSPDYNYSTDVSIVYHNGDLATSFMKGSSRCVRPSIQIKI